MELADDDGDVVDFVSLLPSLVKPSSLALARMCVCVRHLKILHCDPRSQRAADPTLHVMKSLFVADVANQGVNLLLIDSTFLPLSHLKYATERARARKSAETSVRGQP